MFSSIEHRFELLAADVETKARRGRLTTQRGAIDTPAFMPVGTQGSVKAISPQELYELKAQIILGNTYHLFVRPGIQVVRHFEGLHRFINWKGPILTDSGGYQIFSLAKLRKITEEGALFQNHLDGTPAFITPESAMEIQAALGSDIAMVLDECLPWPCEYDQAAKSLERTLRWAKRCKAAMEIQCQHRLTEPQSVTPRSSVFAIVQGSTFEDLRRSGAQALAALDFDGFAIGGVSVGEPESDMMLAAEWSEPYLPKNKPRYAMGLGTPPQMIELIARGIDLFDCVLPTRLARNGTAFTTGGTLNLKNAGFTMQKEPIEEGCTCPSCHGFSRGYIRHLIKAEEILGLRLLSIHNLHFYLELMRQARHAIEEGRFNQFRGEFVGRYKVRDEI